MIKKDETNILEWWDNLSYSRLAEIIEDVPDGIFYELGIKKDTFMKSDVISFEIVKYMYHYGR